MSAGIFSVILYMKEVRLANSCDFERLLSSVYLSKKIRMGLSLILISATCWARTLWN